jgi:hypothetical protein
MKKEYRIALEIFVLIVCGFFETIFFEGDPDNKRGNAYEFIGQAYFMFIGANLYSAMFFLSVWLKKDVLRFVSFILIAIILLFSSLKVGGFFLELPYVIKCLWC